MAVGAGEVKLVEVLKSVGIDAGTLRVRIQDELGNLVFTTSVIPVYH